MRTPHVYIYCTISTRALNILFLLIRAMLHTCVQSLVPATTKVTGHELWLKDISQCRLQQETNTQFNSGYKLPPKGNHS